MHDWLHFGEKIERLKFGSEVPQVKRGNEAEVRVPFIDIEKHFDLNV